MLDLHRSAHTPARSTNAFISLLQIVAPAHRQWVVYYVSVDLLQTMVVYSSALALHCATYSERSRINSDEHEYSNHTAAWSRLCQKPYLLVAADQDMQVPLRICCLPMRKLFAQPDVYAQSACILQLLGKRHPDELPRSLCTSSEGLPGQCSTFGRGQIGTNGPRRWGDIHYRRVRACSRSPNVRKSLHWLGLRGNVIGLCLRWCRWCSQKVYGRAR